MFVMSNTTSEEIFTCCRTLPPKKSCSFDEISTVFFQRITEFICLLLNYIFNFLFFKLSFLINLKLWKLFQFLCPTLIMISFNANQYQFCKQFVKCLRNLCIHSMISFLSKYNILISSQYRFTLGWSTEHAIIDVLDFASSSVDELYNVCFILGYI